MTETEAYTRGSAAAEATNPGLEETLRDRYDPVLPGFGRSLVEVVYGHFYTRPGLDDKTRYLATVAGLTVLGGQTGPQLRIHVQNALNAGETSREVAEVIHQMALYGGFPATISALNAALEVFAQQEAPE
ncbi:carboxymuconolactone decarboxylase family protein [Rhodobacteraceae bacterium CCMM004]|nr:carboxymuconolactone decarboxylase family protein [Rhodobacteraceae bacterium CCMM004]